MIKSCKNTIISLCTATAVMFTMAGCSYANSTTVTIEPTSYAKKSQTTLSVSEQKLEGNSQTTFLNFDGENVIASEIDGKRTVFTSRNIKTGAVSRLGTVSGAISYIVAAGGGGKSVFEYAGNIYLLDPKTGISQIAKCEGKRVTDMSWSDNARYICYASKKDGAYYGQLYDCEKSSLKTIDIGSVSSFDSGLDPLALSVSEEGYAAVQFTYQNDCFVAVAPLSAALNGDFVYSSLYMEKCSSNGGSIALNGARLYYISEKDELISVDLKKQTESVVAENVRSFTVAKNGDRAAFTVLRAASSLLYSVDLQNGDTSFVRMFRTTGRIQCDDSGKRILIQYTSAVGSSLKNGSICGYMVLELKK